jgi:formamidopyrimidine-DNA glycosylase
VPELPETETIARDLDAALRGAVIEGVTIARGDVLRDATPSELTREILGATITGVHRRAKSIVLDCANSASDPATSSGHHLVVTPRFTGALLLTAPTDDRYTCLRFSLADGRTLRYHDIRRLGTVALHDATRHAAWQAALGPEPLDPAFDAEAFWASIRRSRQAIKTVLMDQRKLAGVGNIYANEALWRAGIRPTRAARALRRGEVDALLMALRAVLTESIALRGTTFRDFQDAYGARGGFAEHLAVYGRADAPCQRCATALRATQKLAGRQTVWCPTCQR